MKTVRSDSADIPMWWISAVRVVVEVVEVVGVGEGRGHDGCGLGGAVQN